MGDTVYAELEPNFVSWTVDCLTCCGSLRSMQYFWVQIAGVNSVGPGVRSSTMKMRCSGPPEEPERPALVSSTPNTVTLSFAPAELNEAYLTGFKVYTDDGNAGPWSVDTITDTTQRSFTKYGLTAGLGYKFKVQIISETGQSMLSSTSTMVSAAVPDPPTLFVSSSTNTQIDVGWTP